MNFPKLFEEMTMKKVLRVLTSFAPVAFLSSTKANTVEINDQNANQFGFNMEKIREAFKSKMGRVISDNESIKASFESEGKEIDFTTFDGISIRVDDG